MKNRPLCSICLCLFLLACIVIHAGKGRLLPEFRPSPLEKSIQDSEEILLSGQVYDKEVKDKYQILYLKNNSIKYSGKFLEESKIIIYDKEKNYVRIGQIIQVSGEAGFYESARNPGNFDEKMYYRAKGIRAYIWASELRITQEKADDAKDGLYEFRQYCRSVYAENMSKTKAGVLSAILLGEKGDMDTELKKLYQVNGVGHILAISGLHLSFVGAGLYYILRRMTGSYTAGGIAGCVFLLLYLLMIGFTISVVRAFVMFLFRVGADIAGRHYDSLTALSAAAVIVILWRPLSIYDGGFWLSFGAVAAIILVFPVFSSLPFQGFWASISVNLVLLPVLLYYFYECSVYSVVLNLFIIPLLSVLLCCGIFGGIFCAVSGMAEVFFCPGRALLGVCEIILWAYEKSCDIALDFPWARIVTGRPRLWQAALYYAAVIAAGVLWRYGQKRIKRYVCQAAVPVMLAAGIALLTYRFGEMDRLYIAMLDVGQGDGIFMRGPAGKTYFIDGGSSDVKGVGTYRIQSYLLSQGVKCLDYVFISHGDSDHMNGIQEILAGQRLGVKIETLVLPPENVWDDGLKRLAAEAKEEGVKVTVIEPGLSLAEEEFEIACICPGADYKGDKGNEASMVLAAVFGEFHMLFTGDVEGKGEELLTDMLRDRYTEVRWDVLKTAHHGSKYSSSQQFLDQVKPRYAMISAGKDNRYGHPHGETLIRLANAGCKVYTTLESGAIELEVQFSDTVTRTTIREYAWKQLN